MGLKERSEFVDKVAQKATELFQEGKGTLRYGQCVWNAAITLSNTNELDNILSDIKGTDDDPFYKDSNLTNFYNRLMML